MKRRMLMITPELPYPLQSGGKVKSWHMIDALAKEWEITLVCPLKESDADWVEEFTAGAAIKELICEGVSVPRSAINLLKSYQAGVPLNLLRTYSSRLQAYVKQHHEDFDCILVDHYEVMQFVPEIEPGPDRPLLVYHAHNAYHQIWQRFGETTLNPAEKLVCSIETERVRKEELATSERADLCFAAPNDIQTLATIGCNPDNFKETLHLGDDNNLLLPKLVAARTIPRLCYAGFLGWEPNVQGLLWFIQAVWPTLKRDFPELTLDIAGKSPDKRLVKAVAKTEGIQLLGFVEDLEELYNGSRVAICPLQFGSGIKVKVANAMARGMPMVTTSVGAEGLDVEHRKHLMIADTAEQMAADIAELLGKDFVWNKLSYYSRELIKERYTWDALFKKMLAILDDSLLQKRAGTAPTRIQPQPSAAMEHQPSKPLTRHRGCLDAFEHAGLAR